MLETSYSFLDRLFHRIVLGLPWIQEISLDIDRLVSTGKNQKNDGKPVFICGLARAGTTILMRSIYETGFFRSLTYNDMPFVLMPCLWRRISRPFRCRDTEKERAHGDGILVSFSSPEAFEEIFWKTFCRKDYIFEDCLKTHSVNDEVIEQFRSYIGQVLNSADNFKQSRYLSKNNNNILRLKTIRQAFPDALIIIPFRDPVQQSISLFNLHSKFYAMHEKDRFSLNYMRWLGHHEFGGVHKQFKFEDDRLFNEKKPDDINYWITVWIRTYQFLLNSAPEKSVFFSFEELCRAPNKTLADLFAFAGLRKEKNSMAEIIIPPKLRDIENIDENLREQALGVYLALSSRSQESFR